MIAFIKESIPYIVLLGQIVLLIGIIGLWSKNQKIQNFFLTNALSLGLLAGLLALGGSLFYSDILGYEPCKFCWWQRIFIYPQVVLLGLALIRKDYKIWKYSIYLAVISTFLSLNHYLLQVTGSSILPCSAVGYSSSCSKVFVMTFGYMTIPLMAATTGGLIIVSMLYARRKDLSQN